jgi:DNA-binding NtrC family response regulator
MQLREGLHVLLMSGNPDQELASYGIRRGRLPFVQKPLDMETFLQTVRDVLQAPPPTLAENEPKSSRSDVEWFD